MKKRILGILLALVALVALCAVSVSAEDLVFPTDGTALENSTCQHCDGETVTWLPLTQEVADTWGTDYDPSAGTHYYVSDESVTVKIVEIVSGEELCLHLNGNTITRATDGARPFNVLGTLNLMDHAANAGEIQGYAEDSSTGCVVRLSGSSAKFNMYGGTLRMLTGSESVAKYGGCVYQVKGSTFTMNGGTITDGSASGSGGNVYSTGGTTNLYGGTITGGNASNYGGNVYSTGTVNLGACAVENGVAGELGNNMYFAAAGKLSVKSGFAALTTIALNAAHLPETIEGGYLTDTLDDCEGVFTGKIYLEGTEQLVCLQGKADDTKLYTVVEEENFSGADAMVAKCRHCAKNVVWRPLTSDVWTAWNKTYSQADGTHYYLASDSVQTKGTLSIASGKELCLHLNGNMLDGKSTRTFYVYGTFNLMDHAANEGVLTGVAGSGTTGCVVRVNGTMNMYGGTMQMRAGTYDKGGNGGTMYIAANKTFNMYGGTVTGGAGQYGGNIYAASGSTCNLVGGTVSGGKAVEYKVSDEPAGGYGGNIYSAGTLTLGDVTIADGTAQYKGSDIWLYSSGKLVVKSNFAGEAKIGVNEGHLPSPIMGGTLVDTLDSCEGPFTGKLYLENSSYLPVLYGVEGDTKIYVPVTALVKNGTTCWYGSSAEAMDAYDAATDYLYTGAAELVVDGGAYTVDLAGSDLAVSGSGTVTFFDSANKDYATYGTATVTDVTVANQFETEVDGTKYYMINEGNTYSFHCIKTAISGVSIRPSSSGIYYTGTWGCDDKMAQQLKSFGVAVSLQKVPGANFETDSTCLYTAFGADQMESGVSKTGVIIQGILEEANTAYRNNKNARMPVYASAYMKLEDGTVFVSETTGDFSLYSAMTHLDSLIAQDPGAYAEARANARAFYQTWSGDGMGGWAEDLQNILARVEDGVLNLLMVGNSFCYYYVEELYDLLMADLPEGITEVNIYNLYYSGCRLNQHLDWWKNGTAKYEFYKTDASGRNLLGEKGEWTLEQALVMENWDYISLQGMPSDNTSYPKAEESGMHLRVAELAEPLLDRFHELHPDAQLLWHRTWYFEIGRVSNGFTYTEEYGVGYNTGIQFVCDYMCNEWDQDKPYDLIQVNSGDAWTKVRATEGVDELLPFGGLCARLGYSAYGENLAGYEGETANSGDGYHDGDIGGGQLINAYAWYETLTGNDSTESSYVPSYTNSGTTYTLSQELCAIIRQCVHEVVSAMPETVQPAG